MTDFISSSTGKMNITYPAIEKLERLMEKQGEDFNQSIDPEDVLAAELGITIGLVHPIYLEDKIEDIHEVSDEVSTVHENATSDFHKIVVEPLCKSLLKFNKLHPEFIIETFGATSDICTGEYHAYMQMLKEIGGN